MAPRQKTKTTGINSSISNNCFKKSRKSLLNLFSKSKKEIKDESNGKNKDLRKKYEDLHTSMLIIFSFIIILSVSVIYMSLKIEYNDKLVSFAVIIFEIALVGFSSLIGDQNENNGKKN